MNTHGTGGGSGEADGDHVGGAPSLGAVLITADENLRAVVTESIREAGLPIDVDPRVNGSVARLSAEQLDALRSLQPQIVILDVSEDPSEAIRAAEAIAARCPGSALLGIGPDLDATRLLEAMRAGLVEYVARPVEPVALRDALVRVMRKRGWTESQKSGSKGRLMAFWAAKGGAGATSVMTNLGIELHRLTGARTLLVDLDLELGEIASMLGLQPRFHFVDLVKNFHRMDSDLLPSYIESHSSGVHVLSSPFEPEIGEQVTGEQIARILGFLREHYDLVLVDTAKSLAPPALAALQAADPIVLVTNMDVPSLRNLKRCLPIFDRVTDGEPDRLRLVVNRFNPKSLVRQQDLEETLGLEVCRTLVNDYETVIQSISTGQPLVIEGGTRYAGQLAELARDLAGTHAAPEPKATVVGRLLSPFRSGGARRRNGGKPAATEVVTHG